MDFKDKTVCIIDNGLFIELAVTLSKSFGRVLYYMHWVNAFPQSNTRIVGKGIPGVERIYNYWDIKDEVDLWVFPDIYSGPNRLNFNHKEKGCGVHVMVMNWNFTGQNLRNT